MGMSRPVHVGPGPSVKTACAGLTKWDYARKRIVGAHIMRLRADDSAAVGGFADFTDAAHPLRVYPPLHKSQAPAATSLSRSFLEFIWYAGGNARLRVEVFSGPTGTQRLIILPLFPICKIFFVRTHECVDRDMPERSFFGSVPDNIRHFGLVGIVSPDKAGRRRTVPGVRQAGPTQYGGTKLTRKPS